MATRLENILPQLVASCPQEEREKMKAAFFRLSEDPKGLYALIDYLNFKGAGIAVGERYKGKGWGLLQVLQRVSASSAKPLIDFVEAGKIVLTQRVENSPVERNERQWLHGWLNRLDTYLE
jgi:hypothetical protein